LPPADPFWLNDVFLPEVELEFAEDTDFEPWEVLETANWVGFFFHHVATLPSPPLFAARQFAPLSLSLLFCVFGFHSLTVCVSRMVVWIKRSFSTLYNCKLVNEHVYQQVMGPDALNQKIDSVFLCWFFFLPLFYVVWNGRTG
jgi:hypothetical protein